MFGQLAILDYHNLMKATFRKKIIVLAVIAAVFAVIIAAAAAKHQSDSLLEIYTQSRSPEVSDRAGKLLFLRPNSREYYAQYLETMPNGAKELLVAKEDRTFYWHVGINPLAIAKNAISRLGIGNRAGSSTITQQLAKNLMGNVNDRRLANKISEAFAAFSLELNLTKENILTEYANSIYFGNRLQGLQTASIAYFGVTLDKLTDARIFQLLAAISDPNGLNPTRAGNIEQAQLLAKNLKMAIDDDFIAPAQAQANLAAYYSQNIPVFELSKYLGDRNCAGSLQTTLDTDINGKLRQIIAQNLQDLDTKKAKNAAAIVISLPQNNVLAMAGSPDPSSNQNGYQIDMLGIKRQIGSTIKPFIYLKAFEKGMRPYSLIDDREYKYSAGQNFAIYPENYDRVYHGLMTAHYGLANSINVAAVKTLEFADNKEFGDFVQNELGIPMQQDYSNYQMGVALGVMETDITSLARAFTIFPNNGNLQKLQLFANPQCNAAFCAAENKKVASQPYIQLVNKILADRTIAQDQFSSASDLNLPADNYALKTGTSHDYTDSWIVGYTPDFLVAVWVGNADATAMEGLSGQLGAGRIWNDIMELMLASEYNRRTPLDFSDITEYRDGDNIEYGLAGDDYEKTKNILLQNNNQLILKPHDGDTYRLDPNTRIILKSNQPAAWQVNGKDTGFGNEIIYTPETAGTYLITASSNTQNESIKINFVAK